MAGALESLIGAREAGEWRGALSQARDASYARERDIRTALDEATAAVQAQRQGQVNLPLLMWAAHVGMPTRTGSTGESLAQGLQGAGPAIAQQRNEEQQQMAALQKLRMAGIDAGHSGAMERLQIAGAPADMAAKFAPYMTAQQKLAMEMQQRAAAQRAWEESRGGGAPPLPTPAMPGPAGMDLGPRAGTPMAPPPAALPPLAATVGAPNPDGSVTAPMPGMAPGSAPPPPAIAAPPLAPPGQAAQPDAAPSSAAEFDRLADIYGRAGQFAQAREYQEKAIVARAAEAKAAAAAEDARRKEAAAQWRPGRDPNTGAPGLVNDKGEFKPTEAMFNEGQGKAASAADRIANAQATLSGYERFGLSGRGRFLENLPAVGNYLQSPEYQQYKQARDDFINARLRRESGASISPAEYADADKQFFPLPGDSIEVVERKRIARDLTLRGIAREAGPAYQMPTIAPAREPKDAPRAIGEPARTGPASAMPAPATKADYDKLPSGTPYIAPDGSRRVKP